MRLLVIGSEVLTPYGKRLDLLAIDADGNLHVLELKRDKTPREVVAQVLDYGSWVSTLSRDDVIDIAEQASRPAVRGRVRGRLRQRPARRAQRRAAAHDRRVRAGRSSERIVTYLRGFGVPVNAVFFSYLEDDGRSYLARSLARSFR